MRESVLQSVAMREWLSMAELKLELKLETDCVHASERVGKWRVE